MRNRKDFVVTYTTLDNKARRLKDSLFSDDEKVIDKVVEFVETKKKSWNNDIDYIKKLYADILQSEYYQEYMQMEEVTYADDREVWRKIYKNIIMKKHTYLTLI